MASPIPPSAKWSSTVMIALVSSEIWFDVFAEVHDFIVLRQGSV
jgi:hypothetical protein